VNASVSGEAASCLTACAPMPDVAPVITMRCVGGISLIAALLLCCQDRRDLLG
jgi:hypothetical protein